MNICSVFCHICYCNMSSSRIHYL